MSLATYNKKRDFKTSPEPAGKKKLPGGKLSFVIQRHDASRLHYDFRLEVNGVLKSWAVPKGPSLNPRDKRLAVMVEDHPLAYGKFEGEIPEGNYGAGTVEIWDKGTYTPEDITGTGDMQREIERHIEKGSLKFSLNGRKLKGSFALVQMKDGKGKNWLLIKHKDDYAITKPGEGGVQEQKSKASKKKSNGKPASRKSVTAVKDEVIRSVRAGAEKLDDFITPMLAQSKSEPFDDPDWIYEIKWDGYRAIAEVAKNNVSLYSRNGLSFNRLYPRVVEALERLKENCVLDGEVVVLDEHDRPSFQKLQQYGDDPGLPILYYVFDCLSYKNKDLTKLPLAERKKILEKIVPPDSIIRYSDHVATDGKAFFEHAGKLGLEGIIAKRADSLYYPGKRTGDWLKIKHQNIEEAVIAGYTAPRNSRKYFGALVLGMYQKGKLRYVGHTGTGYTEAILKDVYTALQPLVRADSPFATKVPINAPVTWVEPALVCQVKFTEATDEGILRHPVFMGLRIDKKAKDVHPVKTAKKRPAKNSKAAAPKKGKPGGQTMKVGGHELKVTNLDKLYFADEKITKGDVLSYYNSISKYILPYLKDRPQSLKRNPNGIGDKGFFHKDAGDEAPPWVDTITLFAESANKDVEYIVCNDKATLLYLNNLGCIEINPWNSRTKSLDKPDYLIMDIDPSEKNTFDQVIDTALVIKEVLDKAGAMSFCKTSGASGLHVYVPLGARYDYDQARAFAEIVATYTGEQLPFTTMERSLNKRKGRIYLDYMQNRRGQTLSSVYSLRPVPGASVSTPLDWKEVKHGLMPSDFTIKTIIKRIEKKGDLFRPVLTKSINMERCLKKLSA